MVTGMENKEMSTLFRDKLTGSTFGPWGKVQEERGSQDLQGQAIPSRQDEIRAICAWPSQSCVIWDKSRSHLNQKKKNTTDSKDTEL